MCRPLFQGMQKTATGVMADTDVVMGGGGNPPFKDHYIWS